MTCPTTIPYIMAKCAATEAKNGYNAGFKCGFLKSLPCIPGMKPAIQKQIKSYVDACRTDFYKLSPSALEKWKMKTLQRFMKP